MGSDPAAVETTGLSTTTNTDSRIQGSLDLRARGSGAEPEGNIKRPVDEPGVKLFGVGARRASPCLSRSQNLKRAFPRQSRVSRRP